LPAEHEEQVVDRQQDECQQDELEIGMTEARPGIAHRVAELVGEKSHQDGDGRDLEAREQARPSP
jgi:hypothetical protein